MREVYDVDEEWAMAENIVGNIWFKPFTGKNEPPLRRMERQHLPEWHEDFMSYEERMYRFFMHYRADVEHGRIACSNAEWHCASCYERYYQALASGHARVSNGDMKYIEVNITPKNRKAYFLYCFSKDKKAYKEAWKTLMQCRRDPDDYYNVSYGEEESGQ